MFGIATILFLILSYKLNLIYTIGKRSTEIYSYLCVVKLGSTLRTVIFKMCLHLNYMTYTENKLPFVIFSVQTHTIALYS